MEALNAGELLPLTAPSCHDYNTIHLEGAEDVKNKTKVTCVHNSGTGKQN